MTEDYTFWLGEEAEWIETRIMEQVVSGLVIDFTQDPAIFDE